MATACAINRHIFEHQMTAEIEVRGNPQFALYVCSKLANVIENKYLESIPAANCEGGDNPKTVKGTFQIINS